MRRIEKRERRRRLLVAAVVVAGLALVGAGQAAAKTVSVNCAADPSALATTLADPSLKDGTTLEINGTCKGTFEIGRSLTLAGSAGATLDGQRAGTVLTVDAGKKVDISHLTITGGSSGDYFGVGGIKNLGTLTLTHSCVSGNSAATSAIRPPGAPAPGAVGGIYNLGTLTLTQSCVSGNSGSVVEGFAFGGIFNVGAMTITGSSTSGNTAVATGSSGTRVARAGIENSGTMTITGSSISGNSATAPSNASGGILNSGTMTLSNSSVSANSASADGGAAGGIGNNAGAPLPPGKLTVSNSSVSGNSASSGSGFAFGGIFNGNATITLTNSVVVSNVPTNCNFSDPACAP
jgi:hypothetical protein